MEKPQLKLKGFWPTLKVLIKPFRKKMRLLLLLTVIFELIGLISPYVLKLIIDFITNFQAERLGYLLLLVVLFFAGEQFRSLSYYFRDRHLLSLLIKMEYYLPVKAQEKLMNLGLGYHEKENTGNKIVKIERGMTKISELMGNVFYEVAPTLVQLMVTFSVFMFISWPLALVFAFFAPLFIFLTYRSNSVLYPIRKQRYREYEKASGKMGQSIININAVKSFVQEKRETQEFSAIKSAIRDKEIKEWFRLLNFGLGRNFVVDCGRMAVLLFGVYMVLKMNLGVGTLVFIITLSEKSFASLYRLSRFYDRLAEGSEGVRRFAEVLSARNEIVSRRSALAPKKMRGDIEFKNVSFSYTPNSQEPQLAIDNVSLKIATGAVTAIVGPSGGGKTTVAKLIYRHYDPQVGEILIDGVNVRDYDLYGFRKFLAIVPQEVEIFDLSIKENIAYARPEASFKEIQAAARIANAEEFILKIENKYDALVGERGIKLSGGQRQRLGIARAILANPRILIFDEATSNLDSQSERLIQEAIENIRRDRTMIIIAHRLSTIKKADQIIVLEEGRVLESGSHLELAHHNGGLYRKLLALQTMGELES